jgi:hypothetical protein
MPLAMLSNNPTAPCYMVAYCPHIATLGWCMLLHLGVCIGPDNVGHGENADETLSFSTGDDRQQTDFMSSNSRKALKYLNLKKLKFRLSQE